MDKIEQAADSEYAVVVLVNLETDDVQFVDLNKPPGDIVQTFAARGLWFAGTIGLVNGQPKTALDPELLLNAEAVTRIAQAYVAYVKQHMRWMMRPDMNSN